MNRQAFRDLLNKGILLFDGGMGTQVQEKGLGVGEAPETWNIEHPDWIGEIHAAYVDEGAQAVTTNSFGGSGLKLEKSGWGDRVYQVNMQAAAVAKAAVKGKALVAGSVGPTGEFLQPLGTIEPDEMKEGFRVQIKGLLDGGADLIIIETMTDLDEAKLAISAARELGDFPIIGSMTFNPVKQGYRTMMGVDIPAAAAGMIDAGADVVGSNCGNGIEDFIGLVQEMRTVTDLPILAEANAGMPELVDGKTVFQESPEMMASHLSSLIEAGAGLVGGCCGTTPNHIRHFSDVLGEKKVTLP